MSKKLNLSGKRFGMLAVIKEIENGEYLCRCDCGNEKVIHYRNFKYTKNANCGCMKNVSRKEYVNSFPDSDPYVNLRVAVLQLAIDDYLSADKQEKERLEKWLLSDWGQFYSSECGEIIIERLKANEEFPYRMGN